VAGCTGFTSSRGFTTGISLSLSGGFCEPFTWQRSQSRRSPGKPTPEYSCLMLPLP
jgi:hypothetical protein